MKFNFHIIFYCTLLANMLSAQNLPSNSQTSWTDLSITAGSTLTIPNGEELYISGLKLSANEDITMQNQLFTHTDQSVLFNGFESIDRVHYFSSGLNQFNGSLSIIYNLDELNGIDEFNLAIGLQNMQSDWSVYVSQTLITSNEVLLTNLPLNLSVYGITAFPKQETLDIQEVFPSHDIILYPNPTRNWVNIKTQIDFTVSVYNTLGQFLLSSKSSRINISTFDLGAYFFKITDINNKTRAVFKVLKI